MGWWGTRSELKQPSSNSTTHQVQEGGLASRKSPRCDREVLGVDGERGANASDQGERPGQGGENLQRTHEEVLQYPKTPKPHVFQV